MMGNTHNSQDMKLNQPEKINVQYSKWIDDIFTEVKNVCFKPSQIYNNNGLKLLDKFLEKFRLYIQKKQGHSNRTHDYQLVRASNTLMLLMRQLVSDKNDRDYLTKSSEILGGCTFLWLRYFSLEDEEYNDTHIQSILNCYVVYLQSTADESFLLKIIAHALYMCRKLPKVFYKILDMHLRGRLQVTERENPEVKEDQLYILYIIAFKLWDRLQPESNNKFDIAKYANSYMKPMYSLLRNVRYAPNLPKITLTDVKCGKATGIVIKKLHPSRLLKLAEDLSIDDDVHRSDQNVENDRPTASVNTETPQLSVHERACTPPCLWWVKILHKQFMRSEKKKKESYRVVEIIDLVDEDMSNCESISDTNAQIEVENQSTTDQNKEVENLTAPTEETSENQISIERNSQAAESHRPEPEENDEKNPNEAEKVNKPNNITHEGDNNCSSQIFDKNLLVEPEVDNLAEFRKSTGAPEEDDDIALLEDPIDILELEEEINCTVNAESQPNTLEKLGKTKLISGAETSLQDAQIIQENLMEAETTVKETSRILQTESNEPSSIEKEQPVSNSEVDTEPELNATHMEIMSEKDCHSSKLTQKNNDENENSAQSHHLVFQSNEEKKVKNNEKITSVEKISSKVSPQVPDAIELSAETSEDDEVTSIICMGETRAKSPIVISESDGSEGVPSLSTRDDDGGVKNNLPEGSTLMSVGEDELVAKVISSRPIQSIHENTCLSIDEPLNSSAESLQINDYAKTQSSDDDRIIDDNISISSIVEESENYDTIDPKIDDIHIEKISPLAIVKATSSSKNKSDGSVLFSVSSRRKLSPPRQVEESTESFNKKSPNKDRIVFSTSTCKTKRRSTSPSYTFIPTSDIEHDEIKSPPVESFSKSDTDEFKQIFNNKNHINAHRREKEVTTAKNIQTEKKKKLEHTVENIINKKANQVIKRSILTKTDGNCQNENISTSNIKRKAVSFATVTQDKPPLIINRISNVDSTIIERKTYDSPLTIQNDPQVWRSSINNSPLLSNQQDRTSQEQDQELELLSTSDVNSLGSSSPPPTKESGMTQNMFQFENDTQLSVFNDDAVGNNTEVLPNKSCESDNNLVSATDLSTSNNNLKVKTDLMSSDSELNNVEEDSINMIWQLITDHCDGKPDEKKLQNSLPLKKRRKLSRDGGSFVEVNCKESSAKKSFDYYDKQIAYPAERCMSILQFLDNQIQTTFFVNSNSIAIFNNSPSQQTILTGGNTFNVIAQQPNGGQPTSNANVYSHTAVQTDNATNEQTPPTENVNGNVFQSSNPSNKVNNFEYILNSERSYNNCPMRNSSGENQSELGNCDYTVNSNYPMQRNVHQPMDATLDLRNLNYNANSNRIVNESQGPIGHNNMTAMDINKFNYSQNSMHVAQSTQNNVLENIESAQYKGKYNCSTNPNFIQANQQTNNPYFQTSNEAKVGWQQMTNNSDNNQQNMFVQTSQLGNDIHKYNYPLNIEVSSQNQRKPITQCAPTATEINECNNFSVNSNIPINSNQNTIQNMQQNQRVSDFNCSLNANIESQRSIAQSMQTSHDNQKFNHSLHPKHPINTSQSNVDYKFQSCDLHSYESTPKNLSQNMQLSMETSKCSGNMQKIIEHPVQMSNYNESINSVVNARNTLGSTNIDLNQLRPIHPVMSTQNAYYAVNEFITSKMNEDAQPKSKGNNEHIIPLNMNQIPANMNSSCCQFALSEHEKQTKEKAQSQPAPQGCHVSENNMFTREFAPVEDSQEIAKQQLLGVNMNNYNLNYEHMSNYFHNNRINFAKKRALLQDEDDIIYWHKVNPESEKYLPENLKKLKLKKKCDESRGKQKKARNLMTDRITRSSNRTLPINYKDERFSQFNEKLKTLARPRCNNPYLQTSNEVKVGWQQMTNNSDNNQQRAVDPAGSPSTPIAPANKRSRSEADSSNAGSSTVAGGSGVKKSEQSSKSKVTKPGAPCSSAPGEAKWEPDPRAETQMKISQKDLLEAGPSNAKSGSVASDRVAEKSFAKAASEAHFVVIEADNPPQSMTQRHATFVEGHIWKLLGATKETPKFEGKVVCDGAMKVQCSDEHSLKWLIANVANMPACESIKFKAVKGSDMPKLVPAVVWIPGPCQSPGDIMTRLRIQNPGLDTKYWRVRDYSCKKKTSSDPKGSTLALAIDLESIRVLKSVYGLRPHLGFGRVKFHVSKG